MLLRAIELRFIRCYQHCKIELADGVNVLYGDNGVGKTTILEAIHTMATSKSFKATYLYEMMQHGVDASKIQLAMDNQDELRLEIRKRSKTAKINDKKQPRGHAFSAYLSTVTLTPEHIEIIDGSKTARLQFLDHVAAHQNPEHTTQGKKLNKVTTQLRALLKQDIPLDVFLDQAHVWCTQLQTLTNEIRKTRIQTMYALQPVLDKTYKQVSQKTTTIQLDYVQHTFVGETTKEILTRCYYAKRLLYGAQRDDMTITIDGRLAQKDASQGEKATILLGVKFAELAWLQQNETTPIFLLDDIGTTLDQTRRHQLFDHLKQISCQSVISTCDPLIEQEILSLFGQATSFYYHAAQNIWHKKTS